MPLTALKQAYDSTLLENTATLVQVESALRNLTWFLPGRFQDAELASEGGESPSASFRLMCADDVGDSVLGAELGVALS
jgi:hypothetical protein